MASEKTHKIIGKFVITSKTEVDEKFEKVETEEKDLPLTYYIVEFDDNTNTAMDRIRVKCRGRHASYVPQLYKGITRFEKPRDVWGSFDLSPWLVQEAKTVEMTHPQYKSMETIHVSQSHSLPSHDKLPPQHLLTHEPFYFWAQEGDHTVFPDGVDVKKQWQQDRFKKYHDEYVVVKQATKDNYTNPNQKYYGYVNRKNRPHGHGTMTYYYTDEQKTTVQKTATGPFRDGKKHGSFTIITIKTKKGKKRSKGRTGRTEKTERTVVYKHGRPPAKKQRRPPHPTLNCIISPGPQFRGIIEAIITTTHTPETYQLIVTLHRPREGIPFRYRVVGNDSTGIFAASDTIDGHPIRYDITTGRLSIPNSYDFTLARVDMEYLPSTSRKNNTPTYLRGTTLPSQ